jgi:hypothetical protein
MCGISNKCPPRSPSLAGVKGVDSRLENSCREQSRLIEIVTKSCVFTSVLLKKVVGFLSF